MNPAEAAVLLSKIAANDNREVTEAGARAWAEALPDVKLADAIEYLPRFYREATRDGKNWIYPGDVLNGVVELYRGRRSAFLRAAGDAAVEGRSEDDEDVIAAGGLIMFRNRAIRQAGEEWASDPNNEAPGADIREREEHAQRMRALGFAS